MNLSLATVIVFRHTGSYITVCRPSVSLTTGALSLWLSRKGSEKNHSAHIGSNMTAWLKCLLHK
uniref:Uncharacterized protein n=1 Tax=Octopus bimaculoides TaxID=37653 RepID=A0A0L8FHK7_OCTBM